MILSSKLILKIVTGRAGNGSSDLFYTFGLIPQLFYYPWFPSLAPQHLKKFNYISDAVDSMITFPHFGWLYLGLKRHKPFARLHHQHAVPGRSAMRKYNPWTEKGSLTLVQAGWEWPPKGFTQDSFPTLPGRCQRSNLEPLYIKHDLRHQEESLSCLLVHIPSTVFSDGPLRQRVFTAPATWSFPFPPF